MFRCLVILRMYIVQIVVMATFVTNDSLSEYPEIQRYSDPSWDSTGMSTAPCNPLVRYPKIPRSRDTLTLPGTVLERVQHPTTPLSGIPRSRDTLTLPGTVYWNENSTLHSPCWSAHI